MLIRHRLNNAELRQQSISMNFKATDTRDVRLSKKLSYLLRHGALREKIAVKRDGFVNAEELLRTHLTGYTLDDIKRVVANDAKQRFDLNVRDNTLEIRANQGHSIKEIDRLALTPSTDPNFDIIHGTYLEHWPKIKSEGLSRKKRNYIHFAKGVNFRCGLRAGATVYIYVNFKRAKEANLEFFESANGVILCAGDERGILAIRFFSKVVTREGKILHLESGD